MRPSIQLHMPPKWLFKFPPDANPPALPPPTDARTFASPFPIDPVLYNNALDWKVPVTIATLYATTAILMNKINRDRGNKPWGIAHTRAFKLFVIVHNVFLAIFSAFTFIGMIRALAHTWPGREHHLFGKFWPGLRTENGIAGAADALCKMHGPRGFGDSVYYNPITELWENKNRLVSLAAGGTPDTSDVGRLWNEGLAFWGWWFYLSKFYEVFDTFIILAKGKRSSTLQTYHHTGAMMCMWAGIRYMSPPIWMFAFLNSGIHAMMYVYYTLSAVGIRVPQRVKRTLTTMQISQFIIGITFAGLHLFVSYTVPVSTPYTVEHSVKSAVSAASSAVSSAINSPAATITATGIAAWLKKAAFRAAGEEGLAENVLNSKGEHFGPEGSVLESIKRETHFRTGYATVPCIDTTGQAFAIWLNLAYLAPLTGLFVRFFIRSYSRRGAGPNKHQTHKRRSSKALRDAAHGVERELDSLGRSAEDGFSNLANNIKKQRESSNDTPKSADKRRVSSTIERQWEKFEKGAEEAITETKDTVKRNGSLKAQSLRKKPSEGHDKLRRLFEEGNANGNRSVESLAHDGAKKTKETAEADKETFRPYADEAVDKLEETAEATLRKMKEAVGMHDDSSIAEEDDDADTGAEREPKSLADELQHRIEDTKETVESSWADIKAEEAQEAKDDEDREEEVEQLKQSLYPSRASASESSNPKDPSPAPTDRQSQRSSSIPSISGSSEHSPTLSRQTTQTSDRSPRKSKIPQPAKASSQSRSRSPIKQKSSSIPRPTSQGPSKALSGSSSTNGTTTKQRPASTKDTGGANSDRSHSVQSVHEEETDTNVKQDTEHQRSDSDSVPTATTSPSTTSLKQDSTSLPPEEEQQDAEQKTGSVMMSGEAGAELEFLSRRNKEGTAEEEYEAQGLSTTDPAKEGVSFAEKLREGAGEGVAAD